ncbi:hypothetical protein BBJ28_00014936 [Nothophytophthora sp. Chile5]|nr:hypothetical protein BBJ28_00014936 [Nothophytophthora sp. Chile5]
MKVSAMLAMAALAVAGVQADAFSAEDQAIWIDRHNYFRMTGLPWSAGNMRRMGWDADLATTAATTAAKCSAATTAGVNVYQSTASNSSSILDEAIQSWVVDTSLSTLATLAQPSATGDEVGTGVYNSYSQVVWAATYSVGCATASCDAGDVVVCEYSPAGNNGSSGWYIHADQGSECPTGTTSSTGLCIVEGDAANDAIAAIPAGELTYEVYPAYVANMQAALVAAAVATATGSTATSTATSTSGSTTTTAPSATSATPSTTTATPSTTTATPSKTTATPSTTKATTTSSSSDSSTSTTTKTTTAPSTTTATPSSSSDSSSPGTVKASSDSGSSFTNQATSSSSGTTTSTTSGGSSTVASSPSTASTTTGSTTTESTTASTTTTTTGSSGSTTAVSANNESSTTSNSGVSAAGMAGMVVLGVVAVAAIAVFVSYRKNQQRQRDIMRDGGIQVL